MDKGMPEHGDRRALRLAALAAAVAFLVFLPSLWGGFIWDDHQAIEQPAARDAFQIGQVGTVFSSDYFRNYRELTYRPVVTLSYFLDYALWRQEAFGWRLTNLLLHAVAAAMAFFWCVRVSGRPALSLAAALLFAVHPVQAEVVNNASFREDLLCTVFALVSLLLYEISRGDEKTSSRPYFAILGSDPRMALAALCYGAAAFSKEAAILLVPGVIVFRELTAPRRGERGRHRLLQLAPLLVVGALYALVRFAWMRIDAPEVAKYPGGSFWTALAMVPRLVLVYLRLAAWPIGLHAQRTIEPASSDWLGWLIGAPLVAIVMIVIASLKERRIRDGASSGLAWFGLALVPVLNLAALANPVAERYLYLPSLGLYLCEVSLIAAALNAVQRSEFTRKVTGPIAIVLIAALASRSLGLSATWASDKAIWRHTLLYDPRNAKALNNLGVEYYHEGETARAIATYQRNTALHPDNLPARRQLSSLYMEAGRYEEAARELEAALQLGPPGPALYYDLGRLRLATGKPQQARQALVSALALDPQHFGARLRLALALSELGEADAARKELEIASQLARTKEEQAELRAAAQQIAGKMRSSR